jgi:hypothetical protein
LLETSLGYVYVLWPSILDFMCRSVMSNIYSYISGEENVTVEVGQVTVMGFPDGTYEVIQADPYAHFSNESIDYPPFVDIIARDGAFVMIKGANSSASYELLEQSYVRDTWIGKRLRYQLYRGEED